MECSGAHDATADCDAYVTKHDLNPMIKLQGDRPLETPIFVHIQYSKMDMRFNCFGGFIKGSRQSG